MRRELLPSYGSGTGKQYGFSFAPLSFQKFKYGLIIKIGIIVMHFHRIRMIEVFNILYRDPLSEICLEAVHSHVQKSFQLLLIPGRRIRIGKIHQSHARLPQIRLPDTAVFFLYQISFLHTFFKEHGFLSDIRIDPDADLQTPVMVSSEHPFGIRESLGIPDKVAPFIGVHPVAVKMEYMKGDLPVRHSLYKAGGRLLVIIGGKRSGQPKAEGPGRRQGRFSGKLRIFFHGSHRTAAADEIIIQPLSLHGKLYPLHLLAGDLKGHVSHIIHQNAVSFVGHIERNILIGDLAGSAAVLIPHFHDLPVLHKRREPLAQSVDIFIHINGKLFQHIGFLCLVIIHMRQVAEAGLCKEFLSLIESQFISCRGLVDHRPQGPGAVDHLGIRLCDLHLGICLVYPGEGPFIQRPGVMYR